MVKHVHQIVIDEVFIDKILRDHLANTNVKVEDLEKTLKRMKSALLTRYGKEMTLEDANNDQEHDIFTENILALKEMLKLQYEKP